jgi:hypothetical protein
MESTEQLNFVDGEYVATGEVVPAGCLGKEISDALVAIMVGEKHPYHSSTTSLSALALFVVAPPLLAGLFYGYLPLDDPSLGFVESGLALRYGVAGILVGPGIASLLCVALVVPIDKRKVAVYTVTFTLVFVLFGFVLGELWIFPTRELRLSFFYRNTRLTNSNIFAPSPPTAMGFLICVSASILASAQALFAMIFGKKSITDFTLIKRLAPLLATARSASRSSRSSRSTVLPSFRWAQVSRRCSVPCGPSSSSC